MTIPDNTDGIEKETFDDMIKNSFNSKYDCLIEISKHFDFDLAMKRNDSFKYFLKKIDAVLEKNYKTKNN